MKLHSNENETFATQDLPSYVQYLPQHSVDPDGNVVLLASNAGGIPDELGMAWKLTFIETEARPDGELGIIAEQLNNVLVNVPDNTSCQFILRSSENLRRKLDAWEQATRAEDPLLKELARSRRRTLEKLSIQEEEPGGEDAGDAPRRTSTFQPRTMDVLFTLTRAGTWTRTDVNPLDILRRGSSGSTSQAHERVARAYAADRKKLTDLALTLESLMTEAHLGHTRLGEKGIADELHHTLNPLRARTMDAPEAIDGELLRERAALSSMSVDLDTGVLTIDETSIKIVSAVRLPSVTRAGMLMRSVQAGTFLDKVPEMDLVLNFHVPNQEEVRLQFESGRRMAQDQSRDMYQSPSMAPHVRERAEIERELSGGARVVDLRIHAIVRGRTPKEASDRARAIQAAFQTAGYRAVVEDVLAGSLFLQCVPLAYRPDNDRALRRSRKILTANLAHLAPVYGSFAGTPEPNQLLLNRRGQPVNLAFFNGTEAPHVIVTGKSGAGKSVFGNDLIVNGLRTGGRVWVLDQGGSYRKLTEMLEGTYLAYDSPTPPRFNPCGFALEDGTCPKDTNSFLRDWLTQMATHGKSDLPVSEQNLLSMAIRLAFSKKAGEEVFLRDIHAALRELAGEHPSAKDLAVCISEYVNDGPYAPYVDGPNEIDFENPLVAIDLAGAALEDAVASVLVMGIMYRIAQVSKSWLKQPKYLLIDEAWSLLKSPACARFIENIARTARKFRLSLAILSQQLTDLEGASGRAILGQASYKVCLLQDQDAIGPAAGLLGLNTREVELYRTLKKESGVYSELMLKSPYGSGVARLLMDPLAYWLTTSDMGDRAVLEEILEKKTAEGFEGREALRQALIAAALRYPHGARGAERAKRPAAFRKTA